MPQSEELTFEATSRFAKAGDIRLHYNEAGEGEVLVMLHGGGPGASSWSNFKQNLPVLSETFRVLLVDQPEFGLSDKPEIDEQYWTYSARSVRNLLDELGIERAHFVGNSLGGGTTLKLALEYPERAGRLVLLGPGGATVPVLSPAPSEGVKLLFNFTSPPGPTREKLEEFLRVVVYDQSIVTPELIEERYKAASDPDALRGLDNKNKVAVGSSPEQMREAQLWRELGRIKHQTLLVWGREDRVFPLDTAFFSLRALENARLHVFPRCGHWAHVEHCEEFNRLVIDFLTQPLA